MKLRPLNKYWTLKVLNLRKTLRERVFLKKKKSTHWCRKKIKKLKRKRIFCDAKP